MKEFNKKLEEANNYINNKKTNKFLFDTKLHI